MKITGIGNGIFVFVMCDKSLWPKSIPVCFICLVYCVWGYFSFCFLYANSIRQRICKCWHCQVNYCWLVWLLEKTISTGNIWQCDFQWQRCTDYQYKEIMEYLYFLCCSSDCSAMTTARYRPTWDLVLDPLVSCKLCLGEYPVEQMTTIAQCQCIFCTLVSLCSLLDIKKRDIGLTAEIRCFCWEGLTLKYWSCGGNKYCCCVLWLTPKLGSKPLFTCNKK